MLKTTHVGRAQVMVELGCLALQPKETSLLSGLSYNCEQVALLIHRLNCWVGPVHAGPLLVLCSLVIQSGFLGDPLQEYKLALPHRWMAPGPNGSPTVPAHAPAVEACSWPGGSAATPPLPTGASTARG